MQVHEACFKPLRTLVLALTGLCQAARGSSVRVRATSGAWGQRARRASEPWTPRAPGGAAAGGGARARGRAPGGGVADARGYAWVSLARDTKVHL